MKKFIFILLLTIAAKLHAGYLPLDALLPGQIRFSSKNVEEKIKEAFLKGDVQVNPYTGELEGKYFEGKSLFPESDALSIVKGAQGYVLADGHHHALAAQSLGLPWVPVQVIDDLSALDEGEFWEEMDQRGWVYLYDLEGKKRFPPKEFTQLEEDPNRYFAAITARKCGSDGDMSQSKGAEYPLWIKVGKDIPFIEFKISDALIAHHFFYQYDMGDNPDESLIEEARRILLEAKIPGLYVVPERKHWTEITFDNERHELGGNATKSDTFLCNKN